MRIIPVILFALFTMLALDALNGVAEARCMRGAAACGFGAGHRAAVVGARGVSRNRGGPVNRVDANSNTKKE